jgi:hypothetical protein
MYVPAVQRSWIENELAGFKYLLSFLKERFAEATDPDRRESLMRCYGDQMIEIEQLIWLYSVDLDLSE